MPRPEMRTRRDLAMIPRNAEARAEVRAWARLLVIAVAAGLFLAFVGAFGSSSAPFGRRFAYWVLVMTLGGAWGGACARVVFGRGWLERSVWLQGGLLTLLIAAPFTFVVWLATAAFFGFPLNAESLPVVFLNVTAVAAVMTAINMGVGGRLSETHAAAPGAAPPRFLERLPLRLRGADVFAVEAEDHYLRIHTDRGSDLILMRLSDAVAELEGIEGARAHRSWWVARAAVAEVERGDGRAVFTLKSGLRVPVSRTYARALRAAGWY